MNTRERKQVEAIVQEELDEVLSARTPPLTPSRKTPYRELVETQNKKLRPKQDAWLRSKLPSNDFWKDIYKKKLGLRNTLEESLKFLRSSDGKIWWKRTQETPYPFERDLRKK